MVCLLRIYIVCVIRKHRIPCCEPIDGASSMWIYLSIATLHYGYYKHMGFSLLEHIVRMKNLTTYMYEFSYVLQ